MAEIAQSTQESAAWAAAEFAKRFSTAIETMAGEGCAGEAKSREAAPEFDSELIFEQALQGALSGRAFLAAAKTDWAAVGSAILRGAGMTDADIDDDTSRSTYLETVGQGFGGLAQAITSRLKKEVTPGKADPKAVADAVPPGLLWFDVTLTLGAVAVALVLGLEVLLCESLTLQPETAKAVAVGGNAAAEENGPAQAPLIPYESSKTLPLLLDVELPVSVSFGRAQVPLKEVLKLTTGSIVELNRTLGEPVDVIVNNCVIARGEVVVVEGNFGVRIQQVVSRQERLRTLH